MRRPKILLLQARVAGDPVIAEEHAIFARNAGVPADHVDPHSLLNGPPQVEDTKSHDALMIGGSGEYFVSRENLPQFQETLAFLRSWIDAGRPVFASCFGFQLIVKALGGEITYLPDKMELGTYSLNLTDAGLNDPLFKKLPETFDANLGHKDQATRLPEGAVLLAGSELAPYQAIRIPEKPIWATQFHPEVTHQENLGRFNRYIKLYARSMEPAALQETIDRFTPTPDTERLIPAFMDLVFG